MPKNSEQPASWRAFKPRRAQPEEPVVLDFGATLATVKLALSNKVCAVSRESNEARKSIVHRG